MNANDMQQSREGCPDCQEPQGADVDAQDQAMYLTEVRREGETMVDRCLRCRLYHIPLDSGRLRKPCTCKCHETTNR